MSSKGPRCQGGRCGTGRRSPLAFARGCWTPIVATSDSCATLKKPPIGVRVRTRPLGAVKYEDLRDFVRFFFHTRSGLCGGARHPPPDARAHTIPRNGHESDCGGVAAQGNSRC